MLHPRFQITRQAHLELEKAYLDITEKHNLTALESIGILLECALTVKKFALREERHPGEPDKKGDEA